MTRRCRRRVEERRERRRRGGRGRGRGGGRRQGARRQGQGRAAAQRHGVVGRRPRVTRRPREPAPRPTHSYYAFVRDSRFVFLIIRRAHVAPRAPVRSYGHSCTYFRAYCSLGEGTVTSQDVTNATTKL